MTWFCAEEKSREAVEDLRCDPWIEDTFPCRIRSKAWSSCVSCWSQQRWYWDVREHELLSVSGCRHGTRYGMACGLQSRVVCEPRMACEERSSTRGTNSALLLIRRLIVTFPAAMYIWAAIIDLDKRALFKLAFACDPFSLALSLSPMLPFPLSLIRSYHIQH